MDETYDIDDTYASALTCELGDDYTTDSFVEEDDGTLWWYGRKGSWRAGRHGEEPRKVEIVDHRAPFGDIVITLSEEGDPIEVQTPDGVYTSERQLARDLRRMSSVGSSGRKRLPLSTYPSFR